MAIHDNSGFAPASVPRPQQMIQVLGQLQAHANSPVSSSVYVYDLVEQRTLCSSYPVAAMLGYTSDAIHAMGPVGLARLIHPQDLNRVAEHYQRFTTLLVGQVITIEYRMKRADGTWCRLRSQETPLMQAIDGFPLQILGLVQDITPLSVPHSSQLTASSQSSKPHGSSSRIRLVATRRQKHQRKMNRIQIHSSNSPI